MTRSARTFDTKCIFFPNSQFAEKVHTLCGASATITTCGAAIEILRQRYFFDLQEKSATMHYKILFDEPIELHITFTLQSVELNNYKKKMLLKMRKKGLKD